MTGDATTPATAPSPALSLYHLLDPEVLANPYPLYRRLREEAPVHWDPYLHAWVVTRYDDVVTVLHRFSADRTPSPDRLAALGMGQLTPIAALMVRQMLFLDPPAHSRVRGLASARSRRGAWPSCASTSGRSPTASSTTLPADGSDGCDGRPRQPAAGDRDRRDARRADRGSRAAEGVVPGLRRDARQLPAQPGPGSQGAAQRRGDDGLLPRGRDAGARSRPTGWSAPCSPPRSTATG